MTNKELQEQLAKLDPELEVYAICSSDGVSYEVGYPREDEVATHHDAGPLCEFPNGTKVIIMTMDA